MQTLEIPDGDAAFAITWCATVVPVDLNDESDDLAALVARTLKEIT